MSLLLIVLLLDESHLELVEDVLKEANFKSKDWYKLGKQLQVYDIGQEYIYPGNLEECLGEWLRSGTTSYNLQIQRDGLPTLYDLADALKRIGYSEAAEYIIKTYSKLIIMFNYQCY